MNPAQAFFNDIHEVWLATLRLLEDACRARAAESNPEARAEMQKRIDQLDRESIVLARALDRARASR